MFMFGPLPTEEPFTGPYKPKTQPVVARRAPIESESEHPGEHQEKNSQLATWIHALGGVIVALRRDTIAFNDGDSGQLGTTEGGWVVFENDNRFHLYTNDEFNDRYQPTSEPDEFVQRSVTVTAMQTAEDDIFGSRREALKKNMLVTKWLISERAEMIGVTHNSLAFSKRDFTPTRYYECNVDPGNWIVLEPDGVFRIYEPVEFNHRYRKYSNGE